MRALREIWFDDGAQDIIRVFPAVVLYSHRPVWPFLGGGHSAVEGIWNKNTNNLQAGNAYAAS